MKIIKDSIATSELKKMAEDFSGIFVKAVVDIEKEIMAVEGELHADLMELLMEKEQSEPKNMWGINLYPEKIGEDFIEFDSMINIKPGLGNRTRGVENPQLQERIRVIIKRLVA